MIIHIQLMMKKVMKKKMVLVQANEVIKPINISLIILFSLDVELPTDEHASRHEEDRITTTTRDHNIRRKLDVIRRVLFLLLYTY